jgi:Family of unknown function (DUF5989)
MEEIKESKFEEAAKKSADGGILAELWGFVRLNRKWWMLPMLAIFFATWSVDFPVSYGLCAFYIYPVLEKSCNGEIGSEIICRRYKDVT